MLRISSLIANRQRAWASVWAANLYPSKSFFIYHCLIHFWILKLTTVKTFNLRHTKGSYLHVHNSYFELRMCRYVPYPAKANLNFKSSEICEFWNIHGLHRLGWVGSKVNLTENDRSRDKIDAIDILCFSLMIFCNHVPRAKCQKF